jgi:hypothetical protein
LWRKIYLVLAQEEGEGPFFEKKYLVIVLSKDDPLIKDRVERG